MKKIILSVLLITIICTAGLVCATESIDTDMDIISNINVEDPIATEEVLDQIPTDIYEEETTSLDEIVNDDVYLIDEEVELKEQKIQGNVYIIGEKINIESTIIDGNVFLIGQEVTLKDSVFYGSAYLIAEDLESNAQVRDLYLLGDELDIKENSYVDRSARILGASTKFNGIINSNCYLVSENIDILDTAIIGETLSYYSSKEANIAQNASIGTIDFHMQEKENIESVEETVSIMDKIYDTIGAAVKAAVIAGIMIFLSVKTIKINKDATVGTFFKALGIGVLLLIGIPILSLMLMISIVGLGLGFVLLAIYAIMLYASAVVSCLAIACAIIKEDSKWKIFGTTVLIYFIVRLISIFSGWGALISLLLGLAGLGFIAKNIFYKEKKVEVIQEI